MFKIADTILSITIVLAMISYWLNDENKLVNKLNEIFMLLTIASAFLTVWMWVFNI
jgi:hypothetical protein